MERIDIETTIARLENIAKHAVHTEGEDVFVLSLDDGIAIYEAIEVLKEQQSQEGTTKDTTCDGCIYVERPKTMLPCSECIRKKDATSDLISRQAAIDAIANCTNCEDEKTLRAFVAKHNFGNDWWGGVLVAINAVKDLPSAEPEIVRCKDCKYNVSSHKCLHPESFFLVPDDDFYCGYAERRTDG
jgi:hypothetical protein